jgi:hypothetical protein
MLDKSPEASLRVLRRAESAIAETSPRRRARSETSMLRNSFVSDFFIIAFTHLTMGFSDASQPIRASVRADPT